MMRPSWSASTRAIWLAASTSPPGVWRMISIDFFGGGSRIARSTLCESSMSMEVARRGRGEQVLLDHRLEGAEDEKEPQQVPRGEHSSRIVSQDAAYIQTGSP